MRSIDLFGRHGVYTLTLVCGVALAGCQTTSNELRAERVAIDAAAAAGLSNAIQIDITGGAVDVPGDSTGDLTLHSAIRSSLQTHPGIQSALARVRIAEAEADQSRLLPNPVLNVVLRLPEGGGKSIIEAGLAADLIALLQRPGRTSAADSRLRAAGAEAVSTVLDVLAEVQARYADVQALDDLLPVLEERGRLLDRLAEPARARQRVEGGAGLDVAVLDAQRVELETEVEERKLERRQQRLALARLIGQPSGGTEWRLSPWTPPATLNQPEAVWVAAALRVRPEIQARQFELLALGADRKLANLSPFEGSGIGVDAERDGDWSVGPSIQIPVPLFDMGQARKAGADARIVAARHALTDERRRVVEQVRRAHATFESSLLSLDRVRNRLIPLQERRRDLAEAAFRGGQSDITPLVLAAQDLQAARGRLIELERRTTLALLDLQRAVGGPGAAAAAGLAAGASTMTRPATPHPHGPSTQPVEGASTRPQFVPLTNPLTPATRPANAPAGTAPTN